MQHVKFQLISITVKTKELKLNAVEKRSFHIRMLSTPEKWVFQKIEKS